MLQFIYARDFERVGEFKELRAVDYRLRGLGAIGSAFDSRSKGWEFDSLRPQAFLSSIISVFSF